MRSMSIIAWLYWSLLGGILLSPSTAAPVSSVRNVSGRHVARDLFEEEWWTNLACEVISGKDLQSYSPYHHKCPEDDFQWIRPADSLSSAEKEYLEKRKPKLDAAWTQRLKAVGLENALPEGRTPVVAMALSGGGYRGESHP
jgi:hypothetical protein